MPNTRANRGDAKPTPEPDAPLRRASIGASRRSATLYPAAGPRVPLPTLTDRLLEQELERLFEERLDDASNVAISVDGDCVVLHGIVSCPLASLLAEDLVFSISKITECHNQLIARTTNDTSLAA
jgi:hypothetical protein